MCRWRTCIEDLHRVGIRGEYFNDFSVHSPKFSYWQLRYLLTASPELECHVYSSLTPKLRPPQLDRLWNLRTPQKLRSIYSTPQKARFYSNISSMVTSSQLSSRSHTAAAPASSSYPVHNPVQSPVHSPESRFCSVPLL